MCYVVNGSYKDCGGDSDDDDGEDDYNYVE